jgi:cytochrome c-type biogenesis protein CcmH
LFWIAATAFVMIAMMAVFMPMLRVPKADQTRTALINALAAELSEIEADKEGRFASKAEADAARAEVGRRLLALQKEAEAPVAARAPQLALLLALVPIAAVPAYLHLGQPEYGDQRYATRADRPQIDNQREIESLLARVERRLQEVPDDARGWALIAPVYARMGRFDEALTAYSNAITHTKGPAAETVKLKADRAEVLVAQAQGAVTPEAAAAFRAIIAEDAANQKARFFLAMHAEQTGEPDAAIAAWQALIDEFGSQDPAWLPMAQGRLANLKGVGGAGASASAPGPTPEQVEAAAAMNDADRRSMIEGMVAQLAEKLAADPGDAEGWSRLIRSRIVLGQTEQAAADLAAARTHFAEGTKDRTMLDSFAASFGL